MIDEKKINQATEKYLKENGYKLYIEKAFQDGAQWMQQEFVKSLWHDARERPQKGVLCLLHVILSFEKEDPIESFITGKYTSHGWIAVDFYLCYAYTLRGWCYVDDILPKEGSEE